MVSHPDAESVDPADRPAAAPPALRRWSWRVPAIALVALLALPAAGAIHSAAPTASPAPAASASTGVWAWGAFDNATYTNEYLGAYTDHLNLTNGNVSATDAYVAAIEKLHAQMGWYVVINATAPTPKTRMIHAAAVSLVNDSGLVEVVGNLPAAGTYSPHSTVHLMNITAFYVARVLAISVYSVYSNYTYSNGSLSLVNEQLKAWAGFNTTTIAYNWPTYTANANGTTTLTYPTAAAVQLAWVAEAFKANFTPALTLVKAPLSVGKAWNSTTNATMVGWAAYATAAAFSSGKTNWSSSTSGVTSLNTSAKLGFSFDVVGSQTVIFPNGTQETGYTVTSTMNGATSGAYMIWDGLVVLPSTSPAPAAALHPATLMDRAIAAATPSAKTAAIVGSSGLPVSSISGEGGTAALTAAPMAPTAAQTQIRSTSTPVKPVTAVLPSTSNPPSSTNPPTQQNPPPTVTPPTQTAPAKSKAGTGNPLGAVALAIIVGAIAVAFLAVGIVRARRR